MLEPRESDVPALFLVLVVLPLVAYILLGKWSETVKNRNRITILAHQAAEEALKEEEMTVADVIPPVSSSRSELHVCARCSAPAKTRCSRCKSVRYCSGNCQIIHWRQVHKHECLHLEAHKSNSLILGLLVDESSYRSGLVYGNVSPQFLGHDLKQTIKEKAPLDNLVHPPIGTVAASPVDCDLSQASVLKKRNSSKSNKQTLRRDNGNIYNSSNESSGYMAGSSPSSSAIPKEAFMRQKSRNDNCPVLEEENASGSSANALINAMFDSDNYQTHQGNSCLQRSNHGCLSLSNAEKKGQVMDEIQVISFKGRNFDEAAQFRCSSEMTTKDTVMVKRISHPKTKCSRSPKLTSKASVDFCSPEIEKKGQIADESKAVGVTDSLPSQGNNGNMMGLRKSAKLTSLASSEAGGDKCMKIKMLFPYEEFVKLFQSEVVGICPRGLLNCGNSCYANAVLQCLTSTKPLVVYLLYRSHSKTSCVKDWCLMCELEQHIMMLREIGGPLSPSRILRHMRSINCQMGDGSQEDAHEFLRLLIASMQSICLERLGGEKNVAPWLQETTFVQHTFGGRLQSKVTCLKCNHESERYENIMDLTLEILGWVESLEDALTQFTSPEDLDGENMYRCGRCTAYVHARKKLSIHEAPNILTIVLKRFQEGRYGKINKCITFPEMLDMVPFMTGTGDIPPLYMLYAVVVHVDTLNASFSGHYVSYVKDLQGNWFRIDDIEVKPVSTSQVMSEGAYILFYTRSCPRPQLTFTQKAVQHQVPNSSKCYSIEESGKLSKSGHGIHVSSGPSPDTRPEILSHLNNTSNGFPSESSDSSVMQVTETHAENISRDFSDVTSSDWSLFTSSDEASFTTESTRDSFSTVDYADAGNMDPISSFFAYNSENPSIYVCHREQSYSMPLTGFIDEKGHRFKAYSSQKTDQSKMVSNSSIELPSNGNCGMYVYYGSTPMCGSIWTSS